MHIISLWYFLILLGKDAALEAAYEEISALKNLSSLDLSSGVLETDYKAHLEEYHKRVSKLVFFMGSWWVK